MDIEVNKQKFIKLLSDNKILPIFASNDKEVSDNNAIALMLYFKILTTISTEDAKHYKFGKIPHIKLLRACSTVQDYDNNERLIHFGLKLSRELVEGFEAAGLLKLFYEPSYYYEFTDIGFLFYQELEECITNIDSDIIWVKTLLLSSSVLPVIRNDEYDYYTINESFVKIYLDFIYHRGEHVADLQTN